MNNTIKKWAENLTGTPFIRGVNDCHWLCVEFLELLTLKPAPEEIIKWRGKYSTWQGANDIARTINYDEIFELYDYVEVDDSPKFGDIIRIDHRTRSYALVMPVLYGNTVLWCKKRIIQPVSLDELANNKRVYRRV